VNESTEQCVLCAELSTPVSICQNHFTCRKCFGDHVCTHLGDLTIHCPIEGCDKVFSNTHMFKRQILSGNLYDLHVKKQVENEKWSKLLQKQTQITKGLANLTAGVEAKCPRIVYIVPLDEKGAQIWKWPKKLATTEVQILFVCQHSHVAVKEACFTMRVSRQWVKDVAPAIKFAMFLLKVAAPFVKISAGINFPMESIEKLANELISDPVRAQLDQLLSSKSIGELDWKKLTPIVGPSYDKISEKAHKEKNSEWKNHLVPVLDQKGNIIWVKNEFEVEYK